MRSGAAARPDTPPARATADGHDAAIGPGGALNGDRTRTGPDTRRRIAAAVLPPAADGT
ncbi:hypothetical protein [Streptomyces sp. NPDC004285]